MSAPGYGCMADGCQGKVSWLLTHLSPAATFSLCDDDFPVMVIQLLAAELGADPEKLYDAIKRHVDREAARARRDQQAEAVAEVKAAGTEAADPGDHSPDGDIPPSQDPDQLSNAYSIAESEQL